MNQAAAPPSPRRPGRKVRAPQGMMPGNTRAPGRARGWETDSATESIQPKGFSALRKNPVMVKWRGKSPPRRRQRRPAASLIRSKVKQRGDSLRTIPPTARWLNAGRLRGGGR